MMQSRDDSDCHVVISKYKHMEMPLYLKGMPRGVISSHNASMCYYSQSLTLTFYTLGAILDSILSRFISFYIVHARDDDDDKRAHRGSLCHAYCVGVGYSLTGRAASA